MKQLYEFFFGRIHKLISKKSCLKSSQNSVQSFDDSNATTVYSNSSKIQICPLHSLVLPVSFLLNKIKALKHIETITERL